MTRPNPLPDSLPILAMSSLRNHRVVIASLFLPNTAVLGESYPPTPDVHSPLPLPDVFPGHAKDQAFKLALPPSRARTPAPILSIVEDLKDKASVGLLSCTSAYAERHVRSDAHLSSVSHWLTRSHSWRGARQSTIRDLVTPQIIRVRRCKK